MANDTGTCHPVRVSAVASASVNLQLHMSAIQSSAWRLPSNAHCLLHACEGSVCVFRWVSISTEYLQATQKQYYSVGILLQLTAATAASAASAACATVRLHTHPGCLSTRLGSVANQCRKESEQTRQPLYHAPFQRRSCGPLTRTLVSDGAEGRGEKLVFSAFFC